MFSFTNMTDPELKSYRVSAPSGSQSYILDDRMPKNEALLLPLIIRVDRLSCLELNIILTGYNPNTIQLDNMTCDYDDVLNYSIYTIPVDK